MTADQRGTTERVFFWMPWLVAAMVGVTLLLLLGPALLTRLGLRARATSVFPIDTTIILDRRVYEGSTYTLIVLARSTCPACQETRPLIAELVRAASASTAFGRRLILVTEQDEEEQRFAVALGFDIVTEVVDRAGMRLDGVTVPAVVIVNRAGRILFAIEGRAQPERFQDAAALIKRLSAEATR